MTYTTSDGSLTDTATLTVTVNGENDVPVLGGDITGSVTEDAAQDADGNLLASGTLTAENGDDGEDDV